jgi:hypothetical protein
MTVVLQPVPITEDGLCWGIERPDGSLLKMRGQVFETSSLAIASAQCEATAITRSKNPPPKRLKRRAARGMPADHESALRAIAAKHGVWWHPQDRRFVEAL